MKKVKLMVAITMMVCFLMTGVSFAEDGYLDSDYFNSVMDMIEDSYSGDISREELLEGALRGMFDTMDDYTLYYTKEEAEDYLNDIEGTYKGIGISFNRSDEEIVIVKVFKSSPAERAGIKKGDIIKKVDGVDVSNKNADEVASMIKGEEGTTVTLGIVRENMSQLIEIEVVREEIKIEPGEYRIENDIGYIKLETFNSNAKSFINEALKEMDENNIKKIILDLRDNPG
ncbi:MAG TPA: PDZ domain-containing protein, partial [Acetivibrio saccincola]|nr:PDZ domain-containing protein [Acetivibrio saccincola]